MEEPTTLRVRLLLTEEVQLQVKTAVMIILTEDRAIRQREATIITAALTEAILQAHHHHAHQIITAVAAEV